MSAVPLTRGAGARLPALRVAIGAVALVGLAIAAYLTVVHYTGDQPVCAIAHGCATVQQSDYAALAGIPVALLGLVGYRRDPRLARARRRAVRAARPRSCALAGFGFSAWLTYVEVVRLDAICIWCVGLGDLHDAAGGAVGGARAQRAAARPASVSVKTAGAVEPQIPSGPQSAPAEECTSPRADGLVDRPGQRLALGGAEPRVERVERGGAAAQRAQDLVRAGILPV